MTKHYNKCKMRQDVRRLNEAAFSVPKKKKKIGGKIGRVPKMLVNIHVHYSAFLTFYKLFYMSIGY